MPAPKVYRFEPPEKETWENYLNRVAIYFGLSVYERISAVDQYKKYTKDGVDKYCAGYRVLIDSGLWKKMEADVARHRPQRAPQTR